MNKTQFVAAIANKASLSMKDAALAVSAFADVIAEALKSGEDITLTGFGTFTTSKRSARAGRNPQNGQAIIIPASMAVKFRAGKLLKDAVQDEK